MEAQPTTKCACGGEMEFVKDTGLRMNTKPGMGKMASMTKPLYARVCQSCGHVDFSVPK